MPVFILGLVLGAAAVFGTWLITENILVAAIVGTAVAVTGWTIRKAARWVEIDLTPGSLD